MKLAAAALAIALCSPIASAHDGPPYPIVSDRTSGAYTISIWTDPDATDDESAGGQFWVTIEPSAASRALPPGTRARVSIRPIDRPGPELATPAQPVRGDVTNQFAALVMDHEGRYAVRATVNGPLGPATIESAVDATYDLRPPAYMLAWYLLPFLTVGALWARLLFRRRVGTRR